MTYVLKNLFNPNQPPSKPVDPNFYRTKQIEHFLNIYENDVRNLESARFTDRENKERPDLVKKEKDLAALIAAILRLLIEFRDKVDVKTHDKEGTNAVMYLTKLQTRLALLNPYLNDPDENIKKLIESFTNYVDASVRQRLTNIDKKIKNKIKEATTDDLFIPVWEAKPRSTEELTQLLKSNASERSPEIKSKSGPYGSTFIKSETAARETTSPHTIALTVNTEPLASETPIEPESFEAVDLDKYANALTIGQELGSGGFGTVTEYTVGEPLLSVLREMGLCRENDNRVAIKALKPSSASTATDKEILAFMQEGKTNEKLRKAHLAEKEKNPDISPFYVLGTLGQLKGLPVVICRIVDEPNPGFATEPANHAHHYLTKLNNDPGLKGQTDRSLLIGKWMLQMTRGLKRIHQPDPLNKDISILHRDISARNALIDRNGDAYISDFGLAIDALNQKAITAETSGPLKWMDSIRLSGDCAIAPSDFFGLRAKLLEDLIYAADVRGHSFISGNMETIARNMFKLGEKGTFTIYYEELEKLISNKLSDPRTDPNIKPRLQQVQDLMESFKLFLIEDNARAGLSINQRLTNIYIYLISGFNNLAAKIAEKNDPSKTEEFQHIFNLAAKNDLGEAAFEACAKAFQESARDELAKQQFYENFERLLVVGVDLPNNQNFVRCKQLLNLWDSNTNTTQFVEDIAQDTLQEANINSPEPEGSDILSADQEEEEELEEETEDLEAFGTRVEELDTERKDEEKEEEEEKEKYVPIPPPASEYQAAIIPDSEIAKLYDFAKNPDNKPASYSIATLNAIKPDFTNIDNLLKTFHDQIKEMEKNGFKIYKAIDGKDYLVKFNEGAKLDPLNSIHPNESEIQALRYLRGMLYIAQNAGAIQTRLLDEIKSVWEHYLESTTKDSAKRTRELYEGFAGKLNVLLGVKIEKARKQVSMARDLSIALESHPPICTVSKVNEQLTVEQADLVKLKPAYYDKHFKEVSKQPWFKHAEKNAGINEKTKKIAGGDWLEKFYTNNFDALKANGVPTPSSSRFDPNPANLQKVVTTVAKIKDDTVNPDSFVSSTVFRLATLAPPKIHDQKLQLKYAIDEYKLAIEMTLEAAIQNYYNKYGKVLPPNEIPDFFINNISLLSPWKNEHLVPSKFYDDNNGRFVRIAKKAVKAMLMDGKEITVKVDSEGEQKDFKVKLRLHQTNAAINKRTATAVKNKKLQKLGIKFITNPLIASYSEDRTARLNKVYATEKFLSSTLKLADLNKFTKTQLNAEVQKLNAGNDPKYSHLNKTLQNELAIRMQATFYLRKLLNNEDEYKSLSVYQRNTMMVALEFLALGSQALTFAGCKSARDRTAIFMAAQKTMLEDPRAMYDWKILNAGINRALLQGHHFRAMIWHNGIAKIGAVGSFFFKELPKLLQSAITNTVFSKPFGDPEKHEAKLENKLSKIKGSADKSPPTASLAPPVVPKTDEQIKKEKETLFTKNLEEFFKSEKAFRQDMQKIVNFFFDENGLKKDSDFLALKNDSKGNAIKLKPEIREKFEEMLSTYKTLIDNPLDKAADIDTLLDTINSQFKNFGKQLQNAIAIKEELQLFQNYIQTMGGFTMIGALSPNDYFIKPAQRLSQYPLLLKDLEANATDPALKEKIKHTKDFVEESIKAFNESLKISGPAIAEPSPLAKANEEVKIKLADINTYRNTQQEAKSKANFLTRNKYANRIKAVDDIKTKLSDKTAEDQLSYLNDITDTKSKNYKEEIDRHIGAHSGPTTLRKHLQNDVPAKEKDDMGLGLTNLLTRVIDEKKKYESKIIEEYAKKHAPAPGQKERHQTSLQEAIEKAKQAADAARHFGDRLLRYDQMLFGKSQLVGEEARPAPRVPPRMSPP